MWAAITLSSGPHLSVGPVADRKHLHGDQVAPELRLVHGAEVALAQHEGRAIRLVEQPQLVQGNCALRKGRHGGCIEGCAGY